MAAWRPLRHAAALLAILAMMGVEGAAAREPIAPISQQDSFRIGSAGVLCTAQRRSEDDHYRSLFDRSYEIVCRDAASTVGNLYALHRTGQLRDPAHELANPRYRCAAPVADNATPATGWQRLDCVDPEQGLNHTIYFLRRGQALFAADGLAAYDSALRLGLRALVSDRAQAGEVSVAVTMSGDPSALTRLQAERLDTTQARFAAYAHANDGSYVEAAEYFDTLIQRGRDDAREKALLPEYLANMAIDQSVLGNRAQADLLFTQAQAINPAVGGQFARLFRNLKAMHLLNAHDPAGAIVELDAPLPNEENQLVSSTGRLSDGYIDRPLAQRLAIDDPTVTRLWGANQPLTGLERASLLDAQAFYLRGVAQRMLGKPAEATRALAAATQGYDAVRGGNVASMGWLLADIATESAAIADLQHDPVREQADLNRASLILAGQIPGSAAALGARVRLAMFEARHGQSDKAIADFRELVRAAGSIAGGTEALREGINTYFDTLSASGNVPGRAEDFFAASQVLLRPGVAQTQAVLARELSAGSDAGAALFRQSINQSRELVSLDAEITRLSSLDPRKPADDAALAADQAQHAELAQAETGLLAKLAAFPKFRVVTNGTVDLAELRRGLRSDEGYYKLVLLNNAAYALLARPDGARIFRIKASAAELETLSNTIRDSIVRTEGGQLITDPFDVVAARRMYLLLFGPVEGEFKSVHHLVFEPDGPLLKLPATLLVTEQAGVDAYLARQAKANADAFDFTGVAWLGRSRIVSTSVSPRSFLDVRAIAPSNAPRRYLGLGQNTPIAKSPYAPNADARDPCDWPLATWDKPVNGDELGLAARKLGGNGDEVITGDAFSDTALRERHDLAQFRIVQFATHGLVTAPRPGCPARPALVTSFGARDSDGLLSFREIFDLQFNADTVLLSACDTAGSATAAATREAGVATGGNFALDGLVRAFVGAGARSVVASHWPVPDDFHATERLMSGIYEGGTTTGIGEAMRASQVRLMDDAVTSHPYYWAAFAIVGDATKPITTP